MAAGFFSRRYYARPGRGRGFRLRMTMAAGFASRQLLAADGWATPPAAATPPLR